MLSVRNLFQAAVIATGISLATTLPAHAGVTFDIGNNPQPDEENILLNAGTSGPMVFGETNQSHLSVKFSSTIDTLTEPSNGQARIEAQDQVLNNVTIMVPGGFYKDLIINPFDGDGTADVTVVTDLNTYNFSYELGNGENFLTLFATGADKILSTTIDAEDGFADLRQPRISGAQLFERNPNPVPEPCSMALLATGALPLIGRLRRRRQPA
jgi:hypothetical protein